MRIIVSKFGGSSTANAGMFFRIRDIISGHTGRKYIVLSAPGKGIGCTEKITNLLYECYDLHAGGCDHSRPLNEIAERFSSLSLALGLPDAGPFAKSEVLQSLDISRDHTASRGEYLCALLFSRWMGLPMEDAAGIIHFSAPGILDAGKTAQAIYNMKERHTRAIIPGFYGALPDGSIHTFPRNGSDITGSLIAAGVQADLYENWSDVDGFMTADPSLVPDAVFNPDLSYDQMCALSREGAQILHPDCLAPVCEQGIPTLLKNTNDPEGPGTLISSGFRGSVPCVTGMRECIFIPSDDPRISALPENVPFRCITGRTGREFILARRADINIADGVLSQVSCVCVFGLPESKTDALLSAIPHLNSLQENDCLRIIVDPANYVAAIRTAHDLLIKGV